ncbi:hypothetical protein F4560_002811 [Saccharothrix ecbatanensis]|uniref:Uncharacterized protein n=1 Tax=Saccharothrix ecbatanensis TaxID=1105145 RepID=A0A7W9HIQ1_9PSEU|nr:hypothetical protein [Saccharothrix ecbatanensis]
MTAIEEAPRSKADTPGTAAVMSAGPRLLTPNGSVLTPERELVESADGELRSGLPANIREMRVPASGASRLGRPFTQDVDALAADVSAPEQPAPAARPITSGT